MVYIYWLFLPSKFIRILKYLTQFTTISEKMPAQVLIEEHLNNYLKSLVKGQLYIPGVIIGQVSKMFFFFI